MTTKSLKRVRSLMFGVLLISLLFLAAITNKVDKVEAATTPKYTVTFDYTHNKHSISGTNVTTTKQASGTGVTVTPSLKYYGNNTCTTRFYMYGTSYSGSAVLSNGGWVGLSALTISVTTSFNANCGYTVTDSSGNTVSSNFESTIKLTNLSSGTYNVRFTGTGKTLLGNPSYSYGLECKWSFKVDSVAPTITGASTSATGIYTSKPFTVSASDTGGSGLDSLYVYGGKYTSYQSVGSSVTITGTDWDDLYRFYAKDKASGQSSYYYVNFDQTKPTGKFCNASGNDISGYSSTDFYYEATDNSCGVSYCQYQTPGSSTWVSYVSGSVISRDSTNGTYNFRCVDYCGNTSDTSSIILDTVVPTLTLYDSGGTNVTTSQKIKSPSFNVNGSDDRSGLNGIYVMIPGSSQYGSYSSGSVFNNEGQYKIYSQDKAGNKSIERIITIDKSPPILICEQTDFNKKYNGAFTVSTHDNIGSASLYYRLPDKTSFSLASGASLDVTVRDPDGYYYFYAVDDLGNKSDTFWIEYSGDPPLVTVKSSKTDNSKYITWDGNNYTVKINGSSYIKDTLIKSEGNYKGVVTDNINGREAEFEFSIGHFHVFSETVKPTCSEQGYNVYKCISCDDYYIADYVPATGHKYVTESFEPTCEEVGYTTYYCTVCGYSFNSDYVPKLGHVCTETVVAPICTSKGYTIYTCVRCNYTYRDNYVPELGHSCTVETVMPNCIEEGYSTFTCTRCGYSYFDNFTEPIGHNYVGYTEDATCTERGGIHYVCSRCEDEYTVYTAKELGHKLYEVFVDPTCTERGYINHVCTRCDYSFESDYVSALGHTYFTYISKQPDCEHTGCREHYCEVCGYEYTTDIPAHGHKYVITDKETESDVRRTYTCSECGETHVEILDTQYQDVALYIDGIISLYTPYMVWVFLATSGVWSLAMGALFIIAYRNEERYKAKRMVKNYIIGLIVIFSLLVACPYLIRGITSLIATG